MTLLTTVYRSNIPMDCHILKGRLESEGITCFIHDENLVWVHPFRAVAIGGVKLKVPQERYMDSTKIIGLARQGKLVDEAGEYLVSEVLNNEIKRQEEILTIKAKIRKDAFLLKEPFTAVSKFISQPEMEELIRSEKEFRKLTERIFEFSWKQFLYELFDFNRSVSAYLRPRPADYYLEKELVENFLNQKESKQSVNCPNCHSDNTSFGNAIDFKWDVLYLVLSFILMCPLYLIRKKHHCFNCGHNFKKDKRNL